MEAQIRSIEHELKHLEGEELQSRLETYNRLQSEFDARNGYACESEITGVLKGLGFTEDDFNKQTDTLSGGQKTRVSLGKLLLTSPDILLLDEPTNHLDLNSIAWLETYLINYSGAVFIVSHDRYFLNRVVTKVVEIDNAQVRMYLGNYKDYAMKKQQIRDAQLKEYMNQQREIKHQQAVIDKLKSFNREKSIKRAESREKMLDRITPLDKPVDSTKEMHFTLEPSQISGNDVLTVEHLSKQFDSQVLFSDISFEIKRGEHVAVIGDNGTGKTTLLKIINQVITADQGEFTLGSKVTIGYYDQEHHVLHDDKTIFDEISDDYPDLTNTQIRNTLAAFQFTGDEVFKEIHTLSGGEKGRVSLAKLMLSEANFLILDEPTNHLDITSKEILEEALNNYSGTILYVSHDRYFINEIADRIWELEDHRVCDYKGNYDFYLEEKAKRRLLQAAVPSSAPVQRKAAPEPISSTVKSSGRHKRAYSPQEAEKLLDNIGITCNKNTIPFDPASPFVTQFLGDVNLFHGRVHDGKMEIGDYAHALGEHQTAAGGAATAYIRPHDLDLSREPGEALAAGTVEHIHAVGPIVRVELRREGSGDLIDAALTKDQYQTLRLMLGDRVFIRPKKLSVFLDAGADI